MTRVTGVSLAIALAACGGSDSSLAPPVTAPPVVTTMMPNSSTSLTAPAGGAVTPLPSVVVKDQHGATMAGVLVTFTVVSGGGAVTGSSVRTNASGIATVGNWRLGPAVGSNSLTASTDVLAPVEFIATGAACSALSSGGGSSITSVVLPSLGGLVSTARAINDGGVVVGESMDNTNTMFAVRWTPLSDGSWSIAPIAGPNSRAVAINTRGDAVGSRGGWGRLWPADGGEIDLGPGEPLGINAAETIVGRLWLDSPRSYRAVVWKKPSGRWLPFPAVNRMEDLPALAGETDSSVARAITDLGTIVGAIEPRACRTVRWEPSGDHWRQSIVYSGTDPFYCTAGFAINSANDVAGHLSGCVGCGLVPMFLQSCGAVTSVQSVGASSGQAYGINDAQRVVGYHNTENGRRAFLWWPGQDPVQQLGAPSGFTAMEALGINNRKPAQAVGYGRDDANRLRGIVWTLD